MIMTEDDLKISHYSICFPIAFRVNNTFINEYFTKLKADPDEDYIRWKRDFTTKLDSAIVRYKRSSGLLVRSISVH